MYLDTLCYFKQVARSNYDNEGILLIMKNSAGASPVDEIYIVKLQGVLTFLTGDAIAKALIDYPGVIVDAVSVIKTAMDSQNLPAQEQPFVPARQCNSTAHIQLLRGKLTEVGLWEQSGFTRQQLDVIRLAFLAAIPLQENLFNAADSKKSELLRKESIKREAYNNKRIRHLG